MNSEQILMSQDFEEMIGAPVECTVQVGETRVLPSEVLTLDALGQAGGQEPNLELETLREEAGFLYQDNQKTQQKLAQGQAKMEELQERIGKLEADLLASEQGRQLEKCHFEREIQKQHAVTVEKNIEIEAKNNEIENLKQVMNIQSLECARLKEMLGGYSTIEYKYKEALKSMSVQTEEIKVMEKIVKDHSLCEGKQKALEFEITECMDRCNDMTETNRKLQEENKRLTRELQMVRVLLDFKDTQYKSQMTRLQKLERKLNILQGECAPTRGTTTPRFELRKSYLPECARCKSCLVGDSSVKEECKYHPTKPLPYRSWVRMFPETITVGISSKNMYWPCCKQFNTIEPEGCTSHPNHMVQKTADGHVLARACV